MYQVVLCKIPVLTEYSVRGNKILMLAIPSLIGPADHSALDRQSDAYLRHPSCKLHLALLSMDSLCPSFPSRFSIVLLSEE